LGLLFYILAADAYSNQPAYADFLKFHRSAENLLAGRDLFEFVPMADYPIPEISSPSGQEFFHPNLNPPFQTVLFSPLGLLGFRAAYWIWAILSILCGGLAAVLIGSKTSGARDRILSSLVHTNILLFYFPTLIAVVIGQLSLVPFLFLVLAWLAWREGKLSIAGGILGTLAAIKLFFGAFLLFFLARREWRAAGYFVGLGLSCTLLSAAVAGPDSVLRYVQVLGEVGWFSASWNASFLGFVSRVFGEPGNDPLIHAPQLASVLGKLLSLLGVVLLITMARRGAPQERAKVIDDLAFSACIVVMLLVSPLGWMYYFPFLLIPLSVIWRASEFLARGWGVRLLVILAWLLSTTPRFLVQAVQLDGDASIILGWAGAYFYALILFLVLLWRMQGRLLKKSAPA